jgi:DNA-binding transcriptional ArsR family regulator
LELVHSDAKDFLQEHPNKMPAVSGRAAGVTVKGDEPLIFDWSALVPRIVHPLKVTIIEAMCWIGRPLSAAELVEVFDERFSVSHISYHVRELRKAKVVKKARSRRVRGATETFYSVTAMQ